MENEKISKNISPSSTIDESEIIEEGKIWAILAYLGILCLIPLLMKKDNRFAQHHAKQGLLLFISSFILAICLGIISFVISILAWIPIIGWILAFLMWLIWIVFAISVCIIMITGIVQVLKGKYWIIPVIGKYAKTLKINSIEL